MINRTRVGFVLSMLSTGLLAGCGSSSPAAPSPVPTTSAPTLIVFTETGTGFSTSELRDVHEQVLQLNTAKELIWAADGTRLPGYSVGTFMLGGVSLYSISGNICAEGCAFEVRFGTKDGERRAYLTADYGHDNPGTLVDVEVLGGALAVTRTAVFPPGTPTLSGVVFELTPTGQAPLEGATVAIGISSGYRVATTNGTGVYSIPGLFSVRGPVHVSRDGYQTKDTSVSINGDTELHISLVRR